MRACESVVELCTDCLVQVDLCSLSAEDFHILGMDTTMCAQLLTALGRGAEAGQLASEQQQCDQVDPAVSSSSPAAESKSHEHGRLSRQRSSRLMEVSTWLLDHGFDEPPGLCQLFKQAGVDRLADLTLLNEEDFEALGIPPHVCNSIAAALVDVRRQFKMEMSALEYVPVEPTVDIQEGRRLTSGTI